jgi:hypothetical protein
MQRRFHQYLGGGPAPWTTEVFLRNAASTTGAPLGPDLEQATGARPLIFCGQDGLTPSAAEKKEGLAPVWRKNEGLAPVWRRRAEATKVWPHRHKAPENTQGKPDVKPR